MRPAAARPSSHSTASPAVSKTHALTPAARNACCGRVRREGVTEAAGKLQAEGLIEYSRGNIRILEHAGLEAAACSCYRR